ncbi:hypothetical protein K439DRAFT_550709 [Ramaria rubella]|nr:hypothetical protein K439DRAFT_550709 [Ramaria rubella]
MRCAPWISFRLYLTPRVNDHLAAFLSPVFCIRLAAVVEKEVITLLFVLMTWAWSCLSIKLANLPRTTFDPNPTIVQVFSGQFIGAASADRPRPFAPATAFAYLCTDTSLTVPPLYPYPYYNAGILPRGHIAGKFLSSISRCAI